MRAPSKLWRMLGLSRTETKRWVGLKATSCRPRRSRQRRSASGVTSTKATWASRPSRSLTAGGLLLVEVAMQAQLAIDPHPRSQVQVGAEQQPAQAVEIGLCAADAEARRVDRVHPQPSLAAQRQVGVRPQRDVAQAVQARARLVRQIGVALVRPDQLERRRVGGLTDAAEAASVAVRARATDLASRRTPGGRSGGIATLRQDAPEARAAKPEIQTADGGASGASP
jgi:hypothetical protein